MKREENGLEAFCFGPFSEHMTITVTITHGSSAGGQFVPNQMVDPVTVSTPHTCDFTFSDLDMLP